MLKCEHCKVELPGEQERCPLCQNKPVGVSDGSGNRFPHIPPARRTAKKTLVAWFAFASVCAAAVSVTINIIIPSRWWSLFVLAGIASLWVDLAAMVKKRRNLPKNILWQVVIISLIALIWDLLTGYKGFALDYVFPIICACAVTAMTAVAKSRRLDAQDYILYLAIACILGVACIVFILTGLVRVIIPSAISFGISVIFMAFMLFFEGKSLLAEIQRRVHL